MSLPTGVTGATLVAKVTKTLPSSPVTVSISIAPFGDLTHAESGIKLSDMIETLVSGPGLASQVLVPHSSQAGFVDDSGVEVADWYYVATVTSTIASGALASAPRAKAFQLPTGTLVELETLPTYRPVPADSAATIPDWLLPPRLSVDAMAATYVEVADKGAASGIAGLDSDGKVPADQLPIAIASGITLVSGDVATLNAGVEAVDAASGVVGTVYLTPVELSEPVNITEIGCYVNSAASGASLRVGLYTNTGQGNGKKYTRQVAFGTVPTDTTGAKAIAGSWTLPAGVVWLAWIHLGAAATLRGSAGTLLAITGLLPAGTSPYIDNRVLEGPTGQTDFPEEFTATGMGSQLFPVRFGVKAA